MMLNSSAQRSSRLLTATVPSTPKPKSNSCICNWGHVCGEINKCLTQSNHPLGGRVKFNYTNTCNFQNSWHSITKYLHPSHDQTQSIVHDYEEIQNGKKKKPSGQSSRSEFIVNKHHFDLVLVDYQKASGSGNWVSPLTAETVKELGLYKQLPLNDPSFVFKRDRGGGMTANAKKMMGNGSL